MIASCHVPGCGQVIDGRSFFGDAAREAREFRSLMESVAAHMQRHHPERARAAHGLAVLFGHFILSLHLQSSDQLFSEVREKVRAQLAGAVSPEVLAALEVACEVPCQKSSTSPITGPVPLHRKKAT